MRRRRVLAGVGLAALGVFLLFVPVAPSTSWDGQLASGQFVTLSVPAGAAVLGTPVQVELLAAIPIEPCYGYCPSRNYLLPHYFTVVDCGTSDCATPTSGTIVGSTSDLPFNMDYYFWGVPGHVYHISVSSWATFLPYPGSFPLKVVIVTPWLGGVPGAVVLVGAATTVVTGIRAPEGPLSLRHAPAAP